MLNNNEFLGKEKISKLLFKMSMPATIGMLVMTLYNVVDSIFIGNGVGPLGLAGVTIVFPFMMLVGAMSQGIGLGSASLISRRFGEKKEDLANKTFSNFVSLIFIVSFVIMVLGFIFMDKILIILGTTKTIMPYAKDYLHVLLFGIVFQMFTMSSNSVIRSQGDAKTAMIVMLIGAIVNLILDPIFIFVLDLGIKGAALATITSQFLTFLFTLHYFFSKKSILKIVIKDLILDIKIIKESLAIGISSFARQGSMSLLGILMNNSLKFYGGDLVIAAFGIVYKLMMFLIMPSLGILQGMQPIIGYNYGAKKYKRVKETFYLSVKTSTTIITCFYLFAMFFPELLIRLFTNDEGLILIAKQAFKIIILFFPIVAYQFIASGYFQAIGNAKKAFFLSLLRQLILLIPLIIVLPLFLGLKGIWYSYPIADFFALIITCVITNKEISKLDN